MKSAINYIDIESRKVSADINTIFPEWDEGNEAVCVFSPHDDDAIIGAGYAIEAAIEKGAEVYVFIFCNGDAGYSTMEQKDKIVEIRKAETVNAYQKIGVKKENIIRFEYSDFSALHYIGRRLVDESDGSFRKVITKLREFKITRVLVPNHHMEHIDHLAVSMIGTYDAPQAGDPILVDWAEPYAVKSVLEYSVWADFSPEDALVCNRSSKLRANRIIKVDKAFEEKIRDGIREYKSQGEIIKGLIASRSERLYDDGQFIELYISLDPRPKLDYKPYLEFLKEI